MHANSITTASSLRRCAALAVAIALAAPTLARAGTTDATAAPAALPAAPAETSAPVPALAPVPEARAPSTRGSFSGGRMVVEMLASALVGSLAGYAVFEAAGGDNVGAAFAGLGTEIVVAPLVVYGTGRAMGGRGTVGMAYLGGLIAFSGPSATPDEAAVSLAIGMALMPVTSSLAFELSSHMRSRTAAAVVRGASLAPVGDRSGVTGVRAGVRFSF